MKDANTKPLWFLLTNHWVSLLGIGLVTTACISWLFVLPLQLRGHAENPYIGILVFLVLPILFFVGLGLIPIGVYKSKHQVREGLAGEGVNRGAAIRRIAWFFAITTLVNILIGTQLTYRAVTYMDTPQFCGSSCHTMHPELAAYQHSPHSRVECVDCHVAPGAAGWIDSKTNGLRQLFETTLGTAPKPIPSALESNRLVPARETCENCHWPQNFAGARLKILSKYGEDETNTRTETVLLMFIGGDRIQGIHGAHFGPGVHIHYAAADARRQTIPWVEYRNTNTGDVRTFLADGHDSSANLPKFEMQCVDCHNRPTHAFDLPEKAMDKALTFGDISVSLPFVKKKGLELLKTAYSSRDEAATKISDGVINFYKQSYPDLYAARSGDVNQAAQSILAIYNRNVFPELKVSWGTYPNNLGHMDFPGCFRCHDGSHTTADGKTITQDCTTCHENLASDEASPEILKTLGVADRISSMQKQ
jgi:hypothetical protein